MRLSDLLGAEVVDRDGTAIGAVRDVRLVQDGPLQGTFGAALRVDGLVVGPMALSSRLGYDRRQVRGPWLVAAIARRLNRSARFVPWDRVVLGEDRTIVLTCRADDLAAPPLLAAGRPQP